MAHAQKPHFFFQRNGRVHLNRRGHQFSRLLAAGVCASAVVLLDTPCSEGVWRVLDTQSIRQFPLHFPFRASPRSITVQLESNTFYQPFPFWRSDLPMNIPRTGLDECFTHILRVRVWTWSSLGCQTGVRFTIRRLIRLKLCENREFFIVHAHSVILYGEVLRHWLTFTISLCGTS